MILDTCLCYILTERKRFRAWMKFLILLLATLRFSTHNKIKRRIFYETIYNSGLRIVRSGSGFDRRRYISWASETKSALWRSSLVFLLGLRTCVVVGGMTDAFYLIDNYVTVYIIFAILDVLMYVYNKRIGDA